MSPTSLSAAREVFGQTFGLGSRNHPPRKGAPRKVLEAGNIINLVNPSENAVEGCFVEFISSERIDMVYEEFTRTMSLCVKYSSVLAEDNRVSQCLHFVQPLNPVVPNAPHNRPLRQVRTIAIGTSFVLNYKLFHVSASNGEIVTAVYAVDGEVVHMSNNEMWQIIRSNILG